MAECFIGEIRMFGGNFAPRHWHFCDGAIIPVTQNDALFSLLGTIYGGDGRSTFGLPDMRGRIPIHQGTGNGLTPRPIGARMGVETTILRESEIPEHHHKFQAVAETVSENSPQNATFAQGGVADYYATPSDSTKIQELQPDSCGTTGNDNPHTNMMPFTCVSYIIALHGTYPSRN